MTTNRVSYLTTAEAAEYLRLSKQFLEIARHRGDGPPYIKLARGVRYHRPSLDQWMLERQAELPPEWHKRGLSDDDLEAHYDRGGIVLVTKFVDGDTLPHFGFCYSDGLIGCLKDIQQAGARFDAKVFLEGITGDIARGGLERGRALLGLAAYTLSQPPSLTENIEKHVGVKDQKFVVDDSRMLECPLMAISRHSEGSSRTSALPPKADIRRRKNASDSKSGHWMSA